MRIVTVSPAFQSRGGSPARNPIMFGIFERERGAVTNNRSRCSAGLFLDGESEIAELALLLGQQQETPTVHRA